MSGGSRASFSISIAAIMLALAPAGAVAQVNSARFDWFDYRGEDPIGPAKAGEYRNPILQGFYPDPSVTRVGDDFYLVTSTFSYFPGIPIFHSKDLVNWTQIGNAIDRPGQLDFKKLGLSRGVFAPTIQAKDGIFYILNTCVDCGGNFVVTATKPGGPWSDPVWLPDLDGGIDPSLFFDADGRTWILNNGPPEGKPEYEGHRAIWIQEFDRKTLKSFGPRTLLVNGGVDFSKKPIWIEGPHIFRKDGWYYLSCAEGGTAEGHSQVILRSRSVTGPFLPNPSNPILTQRDLPRDRANPITSAGHAQLVTTPDGKWWATFLAVRPYEGDHYNTGRETFLLPVTWVDGWPRILPLGKEIPYFHPLPELPRARPPLLPTNGPMAVRDTFDGPNLPINWLMMRNPRSNWYRFEKGALLLDPRPEGLGDNGNPSFLARRQQHRKAAAETVVRFAPAKDGDRAGLVALQSDDYWLSIDVVQRGGKRMIEAVRRAGPTEPAGGTTIGSAPLPGAAGAPVQFRIAVDDARYTLSYALRPGQWRIVGSADAKMLSTRTAGGFVGAVFGVHAQSGR
ncbi:glycoside hydrolase family 43 protein [Sphingomonas sp. M1-B02]|uniref:glycoside hydrolase family 43 protein n=1 Tax=Sphingomonas sp. M1-B02 TaxID=3114300 RepID=UPI00223F6E32|nr:glycoside hydrolase family 43 protein [Sphingomonas sp. S6-11]UZK66020.1 glycoside hydrolase family 43 protein [Sphingomonas sp. S6-11]